MRLLVLSIVPSAIVSVLATNGVIPGILKIYVVCYCISRYQCIPGVPLRKVTLPFFQQRAQEAPMYMLHVLVLH